MSKFYAVKKGRQIGVYLSWASCSAQVTGFSGALHKCFATKRDALEYLYDGKIPSNELAKLDAPLVAQAKIEERLKLLELAASMQHKDTVDKINDANNIEETEVYSYGNLDIPKVIKPHGGYLTCDRRILNPTGRMLPIYIDGSKRPTVKHRGSGAYIRFDNQDYYMSCIFTLDLARKYGILDSDFEGISSPTLEYLAFAEVLYRFIYIEVPILNSTYAKPDREVEFEPLNPRLHLAFIGDYLGVKHFTEGSWTAKEDYIIKIRNACHQMIAYLKRKGVDISIHHVRGHRGYLGNELSDVVAKSVVPCDTISQLVSLLSQRFANKQ